jgi:hypothetical protein
LYRLEVLKIFEGYVVDAIPAVVFLLTAALVLCLLPLQHQRTAYGWLAAALILSGIQRGNQALFFWTQIETIPEFVILVIAIIGTLAIASWIMAWRALLHVRQPVWLPIVIAALSWILILTQILSHPWLFSRAMPQVVATVSHGLVGWTRLALLLTLVWIVFGALRRNWREAAIALPAILAMTCFVFSTEVAELHVPGIWFPWGVGVSLSECASVVTCLLVASLVLRRLWL